MNEISELFDNAIEKKRIWEYLKDDVLKLIGNSFIRDVKRKGGKKDNNDKLHNFTYNNNNNNDKLHNFIDNVLNNNDKLHNFSDKILNNLTIVAKMKE